jgi:hypothetical protein
MWLLAVTGTLVRLAVHNSHSLQNAAGARAVLAARAIPSVRPAAGAKVAVH